MFRQARLLLGVFLLVVVVEGCRRAYTFVPVAGTVTQGGKPLEGVQVIFVTDPNKGTEGPRSVGTTDAAGHYRLQTDQGDLGAVVGHHRVYFLAIQKPLPPTQRSARRPPNSGNLSSTSEDFKADQKPTAKVPGRYGSFSETPLRAQVQPGGTQTFDFDIP